MRCDKDGTILLPPKNGRLSQQKLSQRQVEETQNTHSGQAVVASILIGER